MKEHVASLATAIGSLAAIIAALNELDDRVRALEKSELRRKPLGPINPDPHHVDWDAVKLAVDSASKKSELK